MGLFRTITPDPEPRSRRSKDKATKPPKQYKQPKQREPKPGEWNGAEMLRRVGEARFYDFNRD